VPERDVLEVDVLIVGAGPAGLSAALRLRQLCAQHGTSTLSVAVLEKARQPGGHSLSGAVLDPSALSDLVPDWSAKGAPLTCPVVGDRVYLLTARRHIRFPFTPPPLSNHGAFVVSLSALVQWLAAQAEEAGVDVLTGFGGAELLVEGEQVVGVRTTDRGLDRHGAPLPGYEPGADIRAAVTILCDGVRGNLTKQLVSRFKLDEGRQPQTYALGIKELWALPAGRLAAGEVIHTIGFPLKSREFGGAFVYGLPGHRASLGLVTGLDYEDPGFDPYDRFQQLKRHPFMSRLLAGGTRVKYGAKALPEAGWHAIPRLHVDGALIAGDAGGFVNSVRLKGIHLAMRTGMLAAETAFDAVRANDSSALRLSAFDRTILANDVKRELYPVRHVRRAFEHGLAVGLAFSGFSLATRGWWFREQVGSRAGHERMRQVRAYDAGAQPPPAERSTTVASDPQLTFDKLTSVHFSGVAHREDAPSHLIVHDTDICRTRCLVEYGNPCTRFCPAEVYEMVEDGAGGKRLQINAANCVHCKTCDIIDPYQIVDWVPPEGGDGPGFEGM
jgi:electron-transferring-flavoprotein dehydrogenase